MSAGTAITRAPALARHVRPRRAERVLGARDERDVGALGRQRPRDRESDAPTAARDHGAASRQLEIHAAQVIRRPACHRPRACLVSRVRDASFDPFAQRRTALLTTYKRDGTRCATPVTIAVDGDRAYVRTWDSAWKAKRMRNNPDVSSRRRPSAAARPGRAIGARSRLLDGEEARHAARALARRQPILQGVLVPLAHRLMRYRTLHYELTPDATLGP